MDVVPCTWRASGLGDGEREVVSDHRTGRVEYRDHEISRGRCGGGGRPEGGAYRGHDRDEIANRVELIGNPDLVPIVAPEDRFDVVGAAGQRPIGIDHAESDAKEARVRILAVLSVSPWRARLARPALADPEWRGSASLLS